MWSLGCILCELFTGRPLFPAHDENELLELIRVRIGLPSLEMVQSCRKKDMFFTYQQDEPKSIRLIRSRLSQVPRDCGEKSCDIKQSFS